MIIGGTACNLVYAQHGVPERATKDIDLVVLAEAFDRAYFDRFVTFVRAGGYEHRTKDGRCQLFRFERPRDAGFPPKIELLVRRPELLDGAETERVATEEGMHDPLCCIGPCMP